jgi:hypothetical protein
VNDFGGAAPGLGLRFREVSSQFRWSRQQDLGTPEVGAVGSGQRETCSSTPD